MFIEVGEKLHVVYRSLYDKSTRRHFLGEVFKAEGALCRLAGYWFIYDDKKTEFFKKEELRITIIDVAESGYIVNVVDPDVVLENVQYHYLPNIGLAATDGRDFVLNINEFGFRS